MCQVFTAPVAPSLEDVVSCQVSQANPHGLGKLWPDKCFQVFFCAKTMYLKVWFCSLILGK